jgi:hypothetical protein
VYKIARGYCRYLLSIKILKNLADVHRVRVKVTNTKKLKIIIGSRNLVKKYRGRSARGSV